MAQDQRWCLECEDYTLHARTTLFSTMGCLMMMVSCLLVFITICGGLFFFLAFPIFISGWVIAVVLAELLIPWRCQRCGRPGNPAREPRPREETVLAKALSASLAGASSAAKGSPAAMRRIFSQIQRTPATLDRHIRGAWSVVEAAYATLPDWAQPIVWGLVISAPVAVVAIGIWTVARL